MEGFDIPADQQDLISAAVSRILVGMYTTMHRMKYDEGVLLRPAPPPKQLMDPQKMRTAVAERVMNWCAWPVPDMDAPELKGG